MTDDLTPPPVTPSPLTQSPTAAATPLLGRMHPVAFATLALGVVFVLYQLVGGAATLLLAGGRITTDTIALVRWSTLVGQILFILVPTIVLVRLRGEPVLPYLRIRLPEVHQILLSVVAVFFLQQMLQGYMTLQDAIPLPDVVRRYVEMFRKMFEETYEMLVSASNPWEFVFVVVTVALVPAFAEELLFRGLVQTSFSRVTGGLSAAAVTGMIFGAYHLNPFSIVPLVVLGFYFGFLVHRSGSVFVAASAHFMNNFVACAAVYLQLGDDFMIVAPRGGTSPSDQLMNFVVSAFAFSAATLLFVRSTGEKHP
jgi:uncharacterized protein